MILLTCGRPIYTPAKLGKFTFYPGTAKPREFIHRFRFKTDVCFEINSCKDIVYDQHIFTFTRHLHLRCVNDLPI